MPEYLSIHLRKMDEATKTAYIIGINGAEAVFERTRHHRGSDMDGYDLGFDDWTKYKLIRNETSVSKKVLIDLFVEQNTDVAVLANYYAKNGWSLFKVRDGGNYLIFQR
jgi:hypothetical protein